MNTRRLKPCPPSPASGSPIARRSFTAGILAAGAAALGGCTSTAASRGSRPTTMVLVHGAWYGGWCWDRVVPLLEGRGCTAIAPTMRGIGHRAAEASAPVTLEAHVDDVGAVLRALDLRDVVLVGHSYGGMVISLLAERERSRIRKLIYLDAFVPEPGMGVVDYLLPLERRQAIVDVGTRTGFVPPVPARALGITGADDLAYVEARVTPQPFGTFAQKAALTKPAAQGLPRAYIACVEPASGSFGQFAGRIEKDPTWQYRALRTGHCAMIVAPQMLAETLVDLA